jgi:hypothetical protein
MDFGVFFTMVPMWVLVHPRHPSPALNKCPKFIMGILLVQVENGDKLFWK